MPTEKPRVPSHLAESFATLFMHDAVCSLPYSLLRT